MNEQELLFNTISTKERDRYVIFFDKMIDMYYDILKILGGSTNISFTSYFEELKMIADKNTYDKILDKIKIILEMKDVIKNNVNINLLIDSLIIQVGGM